MLWMVVGLIGLNLIMHAQELPELLQTQAGKKITTASEWEAIRRPEVHALFQKHVFGINAVERPTSLRFESAATDRPMLEGQALRRQIKISYTGSGGSGSFLLHAFIPTVATPTKPAPAFMLICNRDPDKNIDPEREHRSTFFPVEALIERGYAALAFFNGDVDPDFHDGFTNGVHAVFQPGAQGRTPESWGTLAAWAWGASRALDWVETEKRIDSRRVAVVGHSRGGKTALWAGAHDTRFALAISNNSGCGGAKLNRMDLPKSEGIARITKVFPHWFCANFTQYGQALDDLPIDAHALLALLAPRYVYVASASEDEWAGPRGEFASCVQASPAWELFGKRGLVGEEFPAVGAALHAGSIGYHLRAGKHNLELSDWHRFIDFADAKYGGK